MYLTTEKRQEIFSTYGQGPKDSGTSEAQIALFTFRIKHLTEHLKSNRKDFSTQLSLLKLVAQRKRLLNYLKNKDITRYRVILEKLELRK